jgi:hypothetical protein
MSGLSQFLLLAGATQMRLGFHLTFYLTSDLPILNLGLWTRKREQQASWFLMDRPGYHHLVVSLCIGILYC